MLRRIHLHGQLGKRFGRVHEYDVDTPAEAVHALAYTIPGFRKYFEPRRYAIVVGDSRPVCEGTLGLGMGKQCDLHITPAGQMAGIETILLIGSLVLSAATAILSLAFMPKAKKPADRESATKTDSFIFDGPQNRTEQGHPVPLVYGRMRTGSIVVSAGIATTDINQASVQQGSGYTGTTPGVYGSLAGDVWTRFEKGGKSGGGAARAAQEDPNSLQSQATARIVEVVSEGEIGGLVHGMQSVFLDDTPIENPDGSFNFSGIAVYEQLGLPDQDYIPGFTQTEATTSIDTKVTVLSGPVTRTISDPDVSLARVTIRIPSLYAQDTTNGDLRKTTVQFAIAVQHNGGGFTTVVNKTFTEKTNSPYQCSFDVALPLGQGPHDIRVTRVTPDNVLASVSNDIYWDLLTEIVEAKFSYPDTAVYGLVVDARQFGSNIPTRSYEIYGLIVEVPTNYDPLTRVYTGIWDGTWKRAWTDNPAWVYRDLVVNRRYGCGSRIAPSALDKWSLYAIAQYNDELIDDGFGGTRPRYTCNCVIDTEVGAYDLLNSIASIFRGWAYWASGGIMVAQDRPEEPSVLVAPANVVNGLFEYSRVTDLDERRSVAIVYWNDPADGYRLKPEIVERPDLVRRFGWRPGESLTAFGCTDQSQARRMALWIFEDEGLSNTAATYHVGDDHSFVQPGQIATLADPMFVAARRGGRVRNASVASVTLDSPVTLASGAAYVLRATLPDGTVETRDVTTSAGIATTLAVSPNWSTAPVPGAVWSLESDLVASRQFRVRNIQTDKPPYQVDAVIHDPTKYARVEQSVNLQPVNYLDLPIGPLAAPSGITISEFLFNDGTSVIPSVQVSWRSAGDPRIITYQAQYLPPGGNWTAFTDSIELSREVRGTSPGAWSFRVRGVDSLGRKTEWVEKSFMLDGSLAAIPNVTGLALVADNHAITPVLQWTPPSDIRPLQFEVFSGPDNNLAHATSLGVTSAFEWPIKQAGFYFVQSFFLTARASSPPYLEIQDSDFPEVLWSSVLGRPVDLSDLDSIAAAAIAQAQTDIDDLFTTYGSTASAAASAAAAAASESAANTYAGTASTAASNASNSASNASTSATNAATSAGQASTFASQASNSATSAAGSASTASTQASLAAGSATAAAGSATAAAGSASTASTQATNASNSASAASAAQVSAQSVAASLWPSTFENAGTYFVLNDGTLAGVDESLYYTYSNDTTYGYIATGPSGSANIAISPKATAQVLAGHKWRWTVVARADNSATLGTAYVRFGLYSWDASGALVDANLQSSPLDNTIVSADGWKTMVMIVGANGVSGCDLNVGATATEFRPHFRVNYSGAPNLRSVIIRSLLFEDVTSELAAAGSASAAATSASTATTQAGLASTSATAAQTSATNASTSASNASTSAGQASTSATNAAGSASSAATQATAASNSATNASNSASAASTSASSAATQATNAGNSASAAASSATTASTQAGIATTQASTATSQASVATTQAAAAQASATLAASVGVNSITANPNFVDYPTTPGQPTSWAVWDNTGNGGNPSRVTGELPGSYAVQEATTSGAQQGSLQSVSQNAAFGNVKTNDYLVIEGHVKLVSGTLQGAGMHLQYRDASNATIDSDSFNFYTEPDSTDTIIGAGTVGKVYRFSKLVRSTVAGVTNIALFRMTGWTGFGTIAAKTLQWFRCSARPASAQEIAAGVALPALSATVTTQGGAIATLQGKTAAYLSLTTAAGSSVAAVRLVSDSYAGSLLELQADAIRLGSANYAAMAVVGSTVYFYGKVVAGSIGATEISVGSLDAISATIGVLRTAPTGGRTEIRDNVIKVYDSSNVLRVKIGDLSL